jgi:hypothetical protein
MPDYAVGEGRQHRSRGAVVESYVDTGAIDVFCPACHAKVDDFCHHKSGVDRRMPCPKRIVAAKAVREGR